MSSLQSRAVRAIGGVGVIALAANLLTGCYTYQPVDTSLTVPTNTDVAIELNDRGRYELGGKIGESPRRVEGRLTAASDSTLTVAVQHVIAIGGARASWAGEQVQLPRTGVSQVTQRQFSRSRTFLAAAIAVATVVLVFVTTDLIGGGGNGNGGDTPPPGGES